jgi:hypothetical protein
MVNILWPEIILSRAEPQAVSIAWVFGSRKMKKQKSIRNTAMNLLARREHSAHELCRR